MIAKPAPLANVDKKLGYGRYAQHFVENGTGNRIVNSGNRRTSQRDDELPL